MGTESGADLDENGNVVARCSSASAVSLLEETEEALRKERQKLKELSFLWGDLCDKRTQPGVKAERRGSLDHSPDPRTQSFDAESIPCV